MKLNKRNYFLLLGFLLFSFGAPAQRDKPLRVEIELPRDATDYKIISLEKNGVVTFYEGQSNHPDSASWVFTQYDTNLVKQKNRVIRTPANLAYSIAVHDNGKIHILLVEKFQKKTALNSYFLSLDISSGNFTLHFLEGFHDENINFIKKVDDHFLLISYTDKKYTIYRYDISDNQIHKLKLSQESIRSIEFCEVDTFMDYISWGMVLEPSSNNTIMYYVVTDYDGNVVDKLPFPRYNGFNYMTARIAHIDSAKSLIMGTYIREDAKSSLPTGIYTMRVNAHVPDDPEFFTDLQIKSKDSTVQKQSMKNDQNLQMVVGGIKKVGGNYALITETFYPEYEYSSYSYGNDPFYGSRSTAPSTTFLGYRFVNASVTAFNQEGELAWNQYLPFRNVLTLGLHPRVSTFDFEENTVIYYIFNAAITYTMVNRFEVIEPVTSKNIVLSNSGETVDYSRNISMSNWYGNYFLLSGYQYLKGKARQSKAKRYVFYMNKVEFR
jgi:hypothetical protein